MACSYTKQTKTKKGRKKIVLSKGWHVFFFSSIAGIAARGNKIKTHKFIVYPSNALVGKIEKTIVSSLYCLYYDASVVFFSFFLTSSHN